MCEEWKISIFSHPQTPEVYEEKLNYVYQVKVKLSYMYIAQLFLASWNPEGLREVKNAYFSLLTHTKQLLLVTFCYTPAGIWVIIRTHVRRTDGGRTDRRGSRNSYLDSIYLIYPWFVRWPFNGSKGFLAPTRLHWPPTASAAADQYWTCSTYHCPFLTHLISLIQGCPNKLPLITFFVSL